MMRERVALHEELFSLHGTPELPDHPALKGARCACGHVFFPRKTYGCEKCGRRPDEIEPVELTGRGRLLAFAKVHRSALEQLLAPYMVGTILLDDGCAVRALLADVDEQDLQHGQTVYTKLVAIGEDEQGRTIVDVRFSPKKTREEA